jgi:hypothetical protein
MLVTFLLIGYKRHGLEVHRVQLDIQEAEQGEAIADKDEI